MLFKTIKPMKTSTTLILLLFSLLTTGFQLRMQTQDVIKLKIVVTFPFMTKDVENILCTDDEVLYLVPPGVDPHNYQLTYKDVEVLSKANLIISTAHTPFETKIREMVLEKEVKAELIEIPSLQNLTFLNIPNTDTKNYHGILFHGDNYIVFIEHLVQVLSNLRSDCSSTYLNRSRTILNKVKEISSRKPLSGFKAIVDLPALQYLASWLGADVVQVVLMEHDVPVMPHDIAKMEENLKKYRERAILIVTEDSSVRDLFKDLASKYEVKIILIPNPVTSTSSILDYLETVQDIVMNSLPISITESSSNIADRYMLLITFVSIVIIFTLIIVLIKVRG